MKKQIGLLGAVAALALSIAPVSAKEAPVGIKPNGCKGPILCDSRPIIDGCGWSLDIGVLVETMVIGNTNFYYIHTGSAGDSWSNPYRSDKMIRPSFNLDAGVRAAIGYHAEHDDWTLKATFEWLSSTGKASTELTADEIRLTNYPAQSYSVPGVSDDYTTLQFREGKQKIVVDYYLLDLTISKGAYFSDKFSFDPMGGIKLNWINYNTTVALAQNSNTASDIPSGTSWLRRNITNFWAVGPMVGFNANYHLYVGWSIFTYLDVAILFGENNLKDGYGFVTTQNYPGNVVVTSNNTVLSPTSRTTIGLQYERDMFDETQHIALRVGFDGRWYYNQYPLVTYPARECEDASEIYLSTGDAVNEGNYFGMLGLLIDLSWSY